MRPVNNNITPNRNPISQFLLIIHLKAENYLLVR